MNTIDYVGYEEIPGQTYLGVYTVKLYLRDNSSMLVGFKVQLTKDGSNFFVSAPSYKKTVDGQEIWVEWALLDSRSLSDEVMAVIKGKVRAYYAEKQSRPKVAVAQIDNPWGQQTSQVLGHNGSISHNAIGSGSMGSDGGGYAAPFNGISEEKLPF